MADGQRTLIVSNMCREGDGNTFVLDPQLWFLLGSTAISICGISLNDSVVSKLKANAMALALEDADLKWFTRLFTGMEKSTLEIGVWLDCTEGRAKVRDFIDFLRRGEFEIVSDESVSFQRISKLF